MCKVRYAADHGLPKAQLPPRTAHFSKQSKSMPASLRALTVTIPDDPAPITQTVFNPGTLRSLVTLVCSLTNEE